MRARGEQVLSRWTETRTLDRTPDAIALRSAATYLTEIGGRGERQLEWRVTPDGTFIAQGHESGDYWTRRDTEEQEHERVLTVADGMLQALVDAVDGWSVDGAGWRHGGGGPLRCAQLSEGPAFVDRFVAVARTVQADLRRDAHGGRVLNATWELSDGSRLSAEYRDRVVPLAPPLVEPPPDRILPLAPDRSLARAQALLAKLATDGLAEVASAAVEGSPTP